MHQQMLLTRRAAAESLSVSLRQIDQLLATGRLLSVHIGRRRLIPRDALESFIAGKLSKSMSHDQGCDASDEDQGLADARLPANTGIDQLARKEAKRNSGSKRAAHLPKVRHLRSAD